MEFLLGGDLLTSTVGYKRSQVWGFWYPESLTYCYDPGSDFSARLLTGYDYGTPQVSSRISHGQSPQSAE